MSTETIFVDESGDPGLRSQSHNTRYPFFIIGFTYCNNPLYLKIELNRLIKKLQKQGKYAPNLTELKFNPYSSLEKLGYSKTNIQRDWEPHFDQVRRETVALVVQHSDGVFAGILDKRTIMRPTWTPERIGNYLFNRSLFFNMLPQMNFSNTPEILYDKGRLAPTSTQAFNRYMLNTDSYLSNLGLKRYNGNVVSFVDADSATNSGIWASDFVAGSFRHSLLYGDITYTSILRPKFIGTGSHNLWF